MPAHDIIDNRNEKLVDHINQILDSSEKIKQSGQLKLNYLI